MSPVPTPRTKRLQLLAAADVSALYDRPIFTDEEWAFYFTLTPAETALLDIFSVGYVRVMFVLQLGYFKVKQRFFSLDLAELAEDLTFILDHVVLGVPYDDLRLLNHQTLQQQRRLILDHFDYRRPKAADRLAAFQLAASVAHISTKPQYLLRIVLQHLAD